MYQLERFGFGDMMDCRARLRSIFDQEPDTVEAAAERVVRFFYQELVDHDGRPACALVRLFKTHPYDMLDAELQQFASAAVPEVASLSGARCLVLLGTAGEEQAWNSRHASRGHKAIPLMTDTTSETMVEQAPMISQLIKQFGVKISTVLKPDATLLLDAGDTAYNVFFVPVALGSPYIVAQKEFVEPYKIESVLGFGGMLASGDLFATIMFTHVPISAEIADLFKVIGLNLKLALLPILRKPLLSSAS